MKAPIARSFASLADESAAAKELSIGAFIGLNCPKFIYKTPDCRWGLM
jgi:hypothetical protein